MSARPGKIGPRHALLDVLAALGKAVSLCGPPSEISSASELTTTWLVAEQVSIVVILGVDRWPTRAWRAVEASVGASAASFVPLSTGASIEEFAEATSWVTQNRRQTVRRWPVEWRTLRAYRLPHFQVSTFAQWAGLFWEDLLEARVGDVGGKGSTLRLRSGVIELPVGVDRCLRAQELDSRFYARAELMTSFGRILRRDELVYAALKGYTDAI